jgi:hypothetical protein
MKVFSFSRNLKYDTQNESLLDQTMSLISIVNHKKEIDLSTKAHNYGNPESMFKEKENFDPHNSLHIENPKKETMACIPKGVYKNVSHNLNT